MIPSSLVKRRKISGLTNFGKSKTLEILIIDDNKSFTNALRKFLQLSGYMCTVSHGGRNGLALIQKEKFDVVVLDLSMPGFSGYDVLDSLEGSGRLKEQKILVLSACPYTNEEAEKMKRRGVYICLRKPVEPDVLKRVLRD